MAPVVGGRIRWPISGATAFFFRLTFPYVRSPAPSRNRPHRNGSKNVPPSIRSWPTPDDMIYALGYVDPEDDGSLVIEVAARPPGQHRRILAAADLLSQRD